MSRARLFEWIENHRRAIHIFSLPALVLLIGAVYIIVYMTGGIKFVYSHSMYIPILLSGFVFGIKGGIFFGLLGRFVLGPFMPIDVAGGEMQPAANWLYRAGFFALVGFFSGAASDSTKSYISHLRLISRRDIDTQLPNRSALFDRLSEIAAEKRAPQPFTLAVISFENVMELKSAFGFAVIDEAVREFSRRFGNILNDGDIYHTATAQLGVLVKKGLRETEEVLDELAGASLMPIIYRGIPLHIDTRMGTFSFRGVAGAPANYLQKAEAALTAAQEKAQARAAYAPEIITASEENLLILGGLEEAVKRGHLSLHYQPKISIPAGDVLGAEALMRWEHPQRGNIAPGIFIPRAEQSTLIQLVTEFALDQAMAQMRRWRKADINLPVAVNISSRNLLQPEFFDLILRLLGQYGLSGELLELEITESELMIDTGRTIAELARLAELKIILSIDDFGTGYSSLQYLHQLPISCIKIDRSFVSRAPADKGASYILEAAVMLARRMGIKSIAEGVEDRGVYDFLSNIGCDIAQGFLISRPLPERDFAEWYTQCGGRYPVSA